MDAHLETEDVDASGKWSMSSKILLGFIVVVLGFILVSMISIALDFNNGWTEKQVNSLSAGSTGEFNTQKPGSQDNRDVDQDIGRPNNINEDSVDEEVDSSVVEDSVDVEEML